MKCIRPSYDRARRSDINVESTTIMVQNSAGRSCVRRSGELFKTASEKIHGPREAAREESFSRTGRGAKLSPYILNTIPRTSDTRFEDLHSRIGEKHGSR